MVEYRVLSSAMMNSTARLNFVWSQLAKAIVSAKCEAILPSSIDVQNAINNSDSKLAESLISSYKLI
jgi:recombinational DNA repair protein RecT